MSQLPTLSRSQKAAAILVAMGKPSAGKLLKFFKQEELRGLIEAARSLKTIPQSELDRIVSEFEGEFAEGAGLLDSGDTMNNILTETLTPEEVDAIMDGEKEVDDEPKETFWPQLEKLPPERVASTLEREHPQTVALVLSTIAAPASAAIMVKLPKQMRGEVVKRMMSLGKVSEQARELVESKLRAKLTDDSSVRDNSAGQMRVAGVLNELDKSLLDDVMEDMVAAGTPDLEELKSKLFAFEDVVLLSQASRVALFDSIQTEMVTVALRGAEPELTEAVLSAIGARSRRMIESELKDAAGNIPADEISAARRAIASAAIRLASEGALELPGQADGEDAAANAA
ncbi:MAG: flagellar motor switch protein FliG [Brucellaceae bacterium]|nr:flagellar motor switch protein FliG [Brucellaceae bacterium]